MPILRKWQQPRANIYVANLQQTYLGKLMVNSHTDIIVGLYSPTRMFCNTFSVILMKKMKTMRTNKLPRTPTEPTMTETTLVAWSRMLAGYSVRSSDCNKDVVTSFRTSVGRDAFSIAAKSRLSHQSQQPVSILDVSQCCYVLQLSNRTDGHA